MLKSLDAGVDQFGGEACVATLLELVRSGRLPEERLDASVQRLLRDKFRLGLFDDPYVDPDAAAEIVGQRSFREAGEVAQRRSIVLLKDSGSALPLARPSEAATSRVWMLPQPEPMPMSSPVPPTPMLALVRLQTPFEPRESLFLEQFFHAGRLDFEPSEARALARAHARGTDDR